MLNSIARVVENFKQSWSREIEDQAILDACAEARHRWRERDLGPITTVRMFLLQILWGNTACNHVARLAGRDVTGSAYCEARARLPLAVFQTLLTRCTAKMVESVRDTGRWLGHRLFMLDGSGFSMSDTAELCRNTSVNPSSKRRAAAFRSRTSGWRHGVHFGSGLIQKVFTAPLRTHDLSGVPHLHPELEGGDVVVADRAFSSFVHLALLFSRDVHGVFRAHQKLIVDFTPGRPHVAPRQRRLKANRKQTGVPSSRWVKSLGRLDQLVEWFRPLEVPSWMSAAEFAALPATLLVRELRYQIARPGFRVRQVTLVTTLLDAERLYSARRSPRRMVCGTDDRDLLQASQDDDEDGCAALPDGRWRAEGVDDVSPGLQYGSHDDANGRGTTGRAARADQLRGCVALAGDGTTRRRTARLGGQPAATRANRTARPQAAAEGVPSDETSTRGAAQRSAIRRSCGLS